MAITDRAMLVVSSVSVWTARRFDRAATREVAEKHGADEERAGRFHKKLIDVRDPAYDDIVKTVRKWRDYHDNHTLPWAHKGANILASAMFYDYGAAYNSHKEEFEHQLQTFLMAYPRLKKAAIKELNGLYKEEDYPTENELRNKFEFRVSFFPIPAHNDFRVEQDLKAEDIESIKRGIKAEVEDAAKYAERKKWERLFDVVAKAVERLSDPDNAFKNTLIENIQRAVTVLPKLSFNNDDKFINVVAEVEKNLAGLSPDRLRNDPDVRADAARKAAEIARKMEGYMKAR
jgi:hypothetical protein